MPVTAMVLSVDLRIETLFLLREVGGEGKEGIGHQATISHPKQGKLLMSRGICLDVSHENNAGPLTFHWILVV